MSCSGRLEATKATKTGNSTNPSPSSSTVCGIQALLPVLTISSSSVMHTPLDEAELDGGQPDDDRHQDHRLRGRAAEIETDHTVVPDPVNEDLGHPCRAPLGHVVDDPEGVEEGIDDVDHQQEK